MKEELKKYLESETKKNNQEVHIRKLAIQITIFLIIIGLGLIVLGLIKAFTI